MRGNQVQVLRTGCLAPVDETFFPSSLSRLSASPDDPSRQHPAQRVADDERFGAQ
jgi:hypothetical protein